MVETPKADASAKRPPPPVTDTIRSHAEWFAWAKRQRADIGRAHNAARAAVKASEEGAPPDAVEKAARAGMASSEVVPVDETRQAYSAWFAVAAVDMGLEPHKAHTFAQAGYQAQKQDPDLKAATAAAQAAVAALPAEAPPAPPPPPAAMPALPDFTPFTTVPMTHPGPQDPPAPATAGDWSPPPPPPPAAGPTPTAGEWAPPPAAEVGDWGPPPGAPMATPPPLPPPPPAPPPPAPTQATVQTDSWIAPTTPPPSASGAPPAPPAASAPEPPPAPVVEPVKDAGAWRPPDLSAVPPTAPEPASGPAPAPPSEPPPAAAAAPAPAFDPAAAPARPVPAAGRQSAIDKAVADTRLIGVTRSQAKLATYGDVRRVAGRTLLQDTLPAEVQLWVVAVAGTLTALAEPAVGHAVAYLALDQHAGVAYDVATGVPWPAWFEQLPDLAPD